FLQMLFFGIGFECLCIAALTGKLARQAGCGLIGLRTGFDLAAQLSDLVGCFEILLIEDLDIMVSILALHDFGLALLTVKTEVGKFRNHPVLGVAGILCIISQIASFW